MMADFMDKDMGDDGFQAVVGLAPFVEQRAAIEEDHVRQRAGGFITLHADMAALIETEDVPFALEFHFGHHLGIGEILDAEQDAGEMLAEQIGQAFDSGLGKRFDIGERWSESWSVHGAVIGQRRHCCED